MRALSVANLAFPVTSDDLASIDQFAVLVQKV